jgi:hypothetical protein
MILAWSSPLFFLVLDVSIWAYTEESIFANLASSFPLSLNIQLRIKNKNRQTKDCLAAQLELQAAHIAEPG